MNFRQRPVTDLRSSVAASLIATIATIALLALPACNGNSDATPPTGSVASGKVLTAWSDPVVGAKVYLVPADSIVTTEITAAGMLDGSADAYDEPLEDLIRSGSATTFPQGTTNSSGAFSITNVDAAKKYFPYVSIDGATPANLYPGGNLSRNSLQSTALQQLEITLSGHASSSATYTGSSLCIVCHTDYASQKTHAHRLGFRRPGVSTAMQDTSKYPTFDDGLALFKPGTQATAGTSLYYGDYDGTRGMDKFRITPASTTSSEIQIFLWKDTANNNTYKITMKNLITGTDPDRTFEVKLTYGGAIYKQRMMLAIPDSGYKGLYPFLQYQHQGDDAFYDRTRNRFRDYHMDFFWDATAKTFKYPDKTKNIEANCMACHATGYSYYTDATTGERLCKATPDNGGAYDINGDLVPNEINTGCEMCHGPGSEHATAQSAKFIVTPVNLTAAREAQICGRCHDRVAGNDDRKNDQPLNSSGQMMMPGESRDNFLTNYTSRKGPKLTSMWSDTHYSKSHHQQYPDFLKSKHYRNTDKLLSCTACHDLHGKDSFAHALKANPKDGTLCSQCHTVDLNAHLVAETGSPKQGRTPDCTECHFYKIAKSGAGTQAILLGTATGTSADEKIIYWKGDISSHVTTIPFSNNPGVVGILPSKAMPIPYTNNCATCHNTSILQFQK